MAERDDDQRRDRYRDNDGARDARENVGRHARGTDADPTGAEGNDRNADRPRRDAFDEDLATDNRRGREGGTMGDLARDTRSSMGAAGLTDDQRERGEGRVQHDRTGQAESPREFNHYEPPRHKEGH